MNLAYTTAIENCPIHFALFSFFLSENPSKNHKLLCIILGTEKRLAFNLPCKTAFKKPSYSFFFTPDHPNPPPQKKIEFKNVFDASREEYAGQTSARHFINWTYS